MNKNLEKKLKGQFSEMIQGMMGNRVYFNIERDKKGKRYTISIHVYRQGGVSKIPPSVSPKFNSVMFAFIYCVGILHTAYKNEQAYFASSDSVIYGELCRLQSDDDNGYGEALAEEMLAAIDPKNGHQSGKGFTPEIP